MPTQDQLNVIAPVPEGAPRWLQRLMFGLIIYVATMIAWLLTGIGGPRIIHYAGLLSGSPAALVPIIMAAAAAHRTPVGTQRKAWTFLAMAFALYYIGDAIGVGMWLTGRDPFPGPADIFFFANFVALAIACVLLIRSTPVRVQWIQLALDATIFVVGFGAFFWFLVIHPVTSAAANSLGQIIAQLYAGQDCVLLLLFGVVLLARSTGSGGGRRASIYLLTGFAILFTADIVWSFAKLRGYYLPGQFQDVLYLLCNVPFAAAGFEQLRNASAPPRPSSSSADKLSWAMPYAAMLAAFIVLVYFSRADTLGPATIMTIVVFALTLLMMVRQTIVLRSDALLREQQAAQRAEKWYASLIANASDVIMIVDPGGLLRFISPASERLLGLKPSEMTGKLLIEVWSGEVDGRLRELLAEIAAAPSGKVGPVELQYRYGARTLAIECVGHNLTQDSAVEGYALNLRDISERKALEEQLRHLAFHDPLTLLANRSLLRDRVQHAIALAQRGNSSIAVMFLDLDHFKRVNDTLGHDAGDRLLQTVSQRLVKATRSSDTVARLGGDEFAVLVEGCESRSQVELLADKLLETLSAPILLNGTEVRVGASIGVAWLDQETDAETLLSNADVAMYHAKAAERGRYVTFQPHMQDALRERLRLETDIDRALANQEFFLEYQPIVDLGSRSLLGVEALVRWRHPEAGMLLPASFIHVIEERGQIAKLDRWVLSQACRELCAWRTSIAGGNELRLAVNISGLHLQHGDLIGDVTAALQECGLEPGNLVLELTESTIMHKTDAILERFHGLKALGVRLAIDDFGVGYSSLSYLHRFPLDILKIDRSFISELGDSARGSELACAVITLGETLGLDTIAEGIESESQVDALMALNCVAGQGFLFQKADSLERLSSSSFVARRKELWTAQSAQEALSPTGRFQALKDLQREYGGAA